MDESFIVLDKRGAVGRSLEESFVDLGSASLLRPVPRQHHSSLPQHMQQASRRAAAAATSSSNQQQQASPLAGRSPGPGSPPSTRHSGSEGGGAASGLDAKLQALAQVFEMASTQTCVDQPLCVDCTSQLKDEVEAQIQEAERDIASYSLALAELEAEGCEPLDEQDFQAELASLRQQEEAERQRAQQVETELAVAQRELASLQAAAADIDELEERYWHDHNDYQLQLHAHMEERDSMLSRIDRASQRLQLLRHTNVYNDAFKIWHDGPFGTISGFRLGRTPEVNVEWDEINAAWGQAVLLMHAMAQACSLQFTTARLIPMGSHPRVAIAGKRSSTVSDLFGPVNKLWSAGYDRAMVGFLSCLREFGDFAYQRDIEESRSPPFQFPFQIDGDKINLHTIKLTLNNDARWTKALKFMMADLKVALQWMVKRDMAGEAPQLANLAPEGPTLSHAH